MVGPIKRTLRASLAKKALKPTAFMNVKRRVIMQTQKGKYVVKTDKGIKYAPKAKYYKNPQGSTVNVKYAHANVMIPSPIRPKLVRKERKNAGAARGKYAPRVKGVRVLPVKRAGYIGQMFEGYAPKRPVGRPRKHRVSPGGNMGIAALFGEKAPRKKRANAGVARGPRASKKVMAKNPFAALM
jgi:hypothetical protein